VELAGPDGGAHGGLDLALRGPDVAQEDGLSVGPVPDRLALQVDVDAAGEREGDDQRR
jgi:hypothetical protein